MNGLNLQSIIDNAVQAERQKRLLTSKQLTCGELILSLEKEDQSAPVWFDHPTYRPTGVDSWRGSYRELAIMYEGNGTCYDQPKPDCKIGEFGEHRYDCPCGGSAGYSTELPKNPTVGDLVRVLKLVIGKYVVGYKGGDFTIGKTTPMWVANYGHSAGFKSDDKNEKYNQAVVGVKQMKTKVVLVTECMEY